MPGATVIVTNCRGFAGSTLATREDLRDRRWYFDLSLTEVGYSLARDPAHRLELLLHPVLPLHDRVHALAQRAENRKNWITADPEVRCYLPGIPRATYLPFPFQIAHNKDALLFSGDTLFFMGVGRADLPGGNEKTLLESIRAKLLTLPPETRVFPGHGLDTTVEREIKGNPFIR